MVDLDSRVRHVHDLGVQSPREENRELDDDTWQADSTTLLSALELLRVVDRVLGLHAQTSLAVLTIPLLLRVPVCVEFVVLHLIPSGVDGYT